MSINDPSSMQRAITGRYQVLLIIWAGQLMALFGLILLSMFVLETREDSDLTLFWVFTGLSLSLIAVSFVVKQKLFAQAVEKQSPALVQQGQIVAMALCEVAGLFAVMARAITGTRYFYLPFIFAVVGMLLHFPGREQLAAATFKNNF